MFTGIIETLGRVESVQSAGNYRQLTIAPEVPFEGLVVGESVAVSGPCLTVIGLNRGRFTVEASQETLRLTTVADFHTGDRVNLERALRADGRLGGHFVLGHIDTTLAAAKVRDVGRSLEVHFELPEQYVPYVIDKGSIALDGISLTVTSAGRTGFAVNVIPETRKRTTWANLKSGDRVNVEFDMIGKFLLRLLEARGEGGKLTVDALRTMGY